jgi:hypothetical protein
MSSPISSNFLSSEPLHKNPDNNFPPTESDLDATIGKIQTHLEFGHPFKALDPKSFRANKRPPLQKLQQEPPAKKAKTESQISINKISSSSAEINSVNVEFITHEIHESNNLLRVEISLTNGKKTTLNLSLDYFNNHIVNKITDQVPVFNISEVSIKDYQCMRFYSKPRETFQYTIKIKLNNGLVSEKMLFQKPFLESNRLKVNTVITQFNRNNEEFINVTFNISDIEPISTEIPLSMLKAHKNITVETANKNQSVHPINKVRVNYSNGSIHITCYTKDGDKHRYYLGNIENKIK